jgi:hypothetical protein
MPFRQASLFDNNSARFAEFFFDVFSDPHQSLWNGSRRQRAKAHLFYLARRPFRNFRARRSGANGAHTRRERPLQYFSRNWAFSIFPEALRGMASTKSTCFGSLNPASFALQ